MRCCRHYKMNRQIWVLTLILTISLTVCGQDTTAIHHKGLFFIKDSGSVTNDIGDCIFCNPEIMTDRILLDSIKTMIARKTSSHLGYVYNEWRSSKYNKTYEEIHFPSLDFKMATYFSDLGETIEQITNSSSSYSLLYSDNRSKTVNRVRVQLSSQSADSLVRVFNIPKDKIFSDTKFWTEINFNENGEIESTGIIVTAIREVENNIYKIGTWSYYNSAGLPIKSEIFTTITVTTK